MKEDKDIGDLVEFVVKQEGRMTLSVDDGTFFFFSADTLKRLLHAALSREDGKAVVFVKKEMPS